MKNKFANTINYDNLSLFFLKLYQYNVFILVSFEMFYTEMQVFRGLKMVLLFRLDFVNKARKLE